MRASKVYTTHKKVEEPKTVIVEEVKEEKVPEIVVEEPVSETVKPSTKYKKKRPLFEEIEE